MGRFVIDVGTRFQQAFGFIARFGYTMRPIEKRELNDYPDLELYQANDHTFEELTLSGNDMELKFGVMPFINGAEMDDIFAPPPMISFSRQKNINVTPISGSDYDVVENYGIKSYDIKMKGLLIDMNKHQYPGERVKKLRRVFEINSTWEVVSKLFEDLGIYTIYFTGFDIGGVEGFKDTQKFTLSAKSTKPAEFLLNTN